MSIRNRELSQFGSFIYINDSTKSVGIATTATPYVGIGTISPDYKFHVVGDTSISGILTVSGSINASQILLNNQEIIDAAFERWSSSGSDIYRQSGNVGIGTSTTTEKLTVIGNVSATRFISTVTTGTSPLVVNSQTLVANLNSDYLRGKVPPGGDIVGTTDSQVLSNKTLSFPLFEGTGVRFNGSTSGVTTVVASSTASGVLTLPSTGGNLISTNDSSVISSGMIIDGTIVNADISNSAAITYSKLNLSNSITNSDIAVGAAITNGKLQNSTISGVSLGSNLNNLTAGSYISYDSGTTYNGSSTITIGVAGTTLNTSNTLVARDASGDFSAGTVSCANINATFNVSSSTASITNLSAQQLSVTGVSTFSGITTHTAQIFGTNVSLSGILTAVDFNSTSDINLKTNITTVDNALDTVNSLRGVKFEWKEDSRTSYGVIAQELEEILPDLVSSGDIKTVNYNGIIGILIEAIKELKSEIDELKNSK